MATNEMPQIPSNLVKYIIGGAVILGIVILIVSSMFTVDTYEKAVVLQLGKFKEQVGPGLHFRIPGIETYEIVNTSLQTEDFGSKTHSKDYNVGNYAQDQEISSSNNEESIMLTGDINIGNVNWTIMYRIKDPVQYLYRIDDPIGTLRALSESVMRKVIGNNWIDDVLGSKKEEIGRQVKDNLQELMDAYKVGITIESVLLRDVTPPKEVSEAFNDVIKAKQRKEQRKREAEKQLNKDVSEAKGEADKLKKQAEGYAQRRLTEAKGELDKLKSVYLKYKEFRKENKERIFLETMEEIYKKIDNKVILDSDRLLPLLSLDQNTLKSKFAEATLKKGGK